MLTLSFKISPDQEHDDSVMFNLICEDVPASMVQNIEFEFVGNNMTLTPAKLSLKDIFDPATKGAVVKIRGDFTAQGQATATMSASLSGKPMGSARHTFNV